MSQGPIYLLKSIPGKLLSSENFSCQTFLSSIHMLRTFKASSPWMHLAHSSSKITAFNFAIGTMRNFCLHGASSGFGGSCWEEEACFHHKCWAFCECGQESSWAGGWSPFLWPIWESGQFPGPWDHRHWNLGSNTWPDRCFCLWLRWHFHLTNYNHTSQALISCPWVS